MKDALLEIILSGATSHPMLVKLELARQINMAHGAPVIAAWDIDELPEEWIEACTFSIRELPKLQQGLSEVEKIKNRIRNEHKERLH